MAVSAAVRIPDEFRTAISAAVGIPDEFRMEILAAVRILDEFWIASLGSVVWPHVASQSRGFIFVSGEFATPRYARA